MASQVPKDAEVSAIRKRPGDPEPLPALGQREPHVVPRICDRLFDASGAWDMYRCAARGGYHDPMNVAFSEDRFDAITCQPVIEHVHDPLN